MTAILSLAAGSDFVEVGCAKHPRYEGIRAPFGSVRRDCLACNALYWLRYAMRHDENFVWRPA